MSSIFADEREGCSYMSRSSNTGKQILIVAGILLLASILTYFLGELAAKGFLGGKVTLSKWAEQYQKLVMILFVLQAIVYFGWYICAKFIWKVRECDDGNKRGRWYLFWGISGVISLIIPYAVSLTNNVLKMSIIIPIICLIFYTVIGYWVASIFATPAAYKYEPLGAQKFRQKKGFKGGNN